jgi:hypothetical protein
MVTHVSELNNALGLIVEPFRSAMVDVEVEWREGNHLLKWRTLLRNCFRSIKYTRVTNNIDEFTDTST